MRDAPLTIRSAEIDGTGVADVRIENGQIAAIGKNLEAAGEELDGRGGALIPGLCDHHIHLLALAAQVNSLSLEQARDKADMSRLIGAATSRLEVGAWLRCTGYHETLAGDLTVGDLDELAPRHRLRVQHQTGALWILNSRALASVTENTSIPDFLERDEKGELTGRIWRGDAWLRDRVGAAHPSLAVVGRELARFGITSVTDASATTDRTAADILSAAHRRGDVPQHIALMSAGELEAPADAAFSIGAMKVLLDDHDLPSIDELADSIARARLSGRNVAVHCVTSLQLAVSLAAFRAAKAVDGDRIEHGSIIAPEAIAELRALGLTVVTQPGLVFARGDRYAVEVDRGEQADLYRCGSLLSANVKVAAGSDAPYGPLDPWLAVRTAATRRTEGGGFLGAVERIPASKALGLYLGQPSAPGGALRRVRKDAAADLCLLKVPLREAMSAPHCEIVRATIVDGLIVYREGA